MSRRDCARARRSAPPPASLPCTGGPWPTSRCSGTNGAVPSAAAMRRIGCTPAGPGPTAYMRRGADRLRRRRAPCGSGHHSARSFQAGPQSRLSTENGVSGSTSRHLADAARPAACATASPSRLWAIEQLQRRRRARRAPRRAPAPRRRRPGRRTTRGRRRRARALRAAADRRRPRSGPADVRASSLCHSHGSRPYPSPQCEVASPPHWFVQPPAHWPGVRWRGVLAATRFVRARRPVLHTKGRHHAQGHRPHQVPRRRAAVRRRSRSRSTTARAPGSSAPTASARRRCCGCWPGVDRPDRGAVALGAGDRDRLPAAGRARPARDDRRPLATSARRGVGGEARARRARGRPDRPRRLRRARRRASRRSAAGRWRRGWTRRGAGSGIEHLDRGAPLGRAVRRRGGALPAGRGAARRPDRAAARRAHQPPRRRRPRVAGGVAGRVRRHAADGLARPRVPRRHRRPRPRALGRRAGDLRGRLHRLQGGARAPARAARAARRGAGQAPPRGSRPTSP